MVHVFRSWNRPQYIPFRYQHPSGLLYRVRSPRSRLPYTSRHLVQGNLPKPFMSCSWRIKWIIHVSIQNGFQPCFERLQWWFTRIAWSIFPQLPHFPQGQDRVPILTGGRYTVADSSLLIDGAQSSDTGLYVVKAYNGVGSAAYANATISLGLSVAFLKCCQWRYQIFV